MKVGILLISALFLVGCNSQQPQTTLLQSNENLSNSSSALAFDPPIAMNTAALDLNRSTRGEAAFAGFENTSTTYVDVYTDDRQTSDNTDRFVREGRSDKISALTR